MDRKLAKRLLKERGRIILTQTEGYQAERCPECGTPLSVDQYCLLCGWGKSIAQKT